MIRVQPFRRRLLLDPDGLGSERPSLFHHPACHLGVDVSASTTAAGTATGKTGGGNVFNAGSVFGSVSNSTTSGGSAGLGAAAAGNSSAALAASVPQWVWWLAAAIGAAIIGIAVKKHFK